MEYLKDRVKRDTFMCSKILNMFRRGELRRNHPQQRKANNWDRQTRDGFIATVIKQEDVNPVIVCEQYVETGIALWLIDGLQRLSTLEFFKKGYFRLGKNIEYPIVQYQVTKLDDKGNFIKNADNSLMYENIDFDLRGKAYKDLPEQLRENFDSYAITIVKHLDCTEEEIGYHIRRYNHQKPMNTSQQSITYMDSTAKCVKDISNYHRFFKDCGVYSLNEKKNGVIDRVVLETLSAVYFLDNWQKQSKKMAMYINKNAKKEQFDYIKTLFDRLYNIIDEDLSKYFNSKNTFIFAALFYRFTKLNIPDVRFADFLRNFEAIREREVDGETFDNVSASRSTKDKKVVTKKMDILEVLMKEFLADDIKKAETKAETVREAEIKANTEPSAEELSAFIQENLNTSVTEEDIDLYKDVLNDLSVNVPTDSKLLDKANMPSLIALNCYAFINDIDLDEWFADYALRQTNYNIDQKQNYYEMLKDLTDFLSKENQKALAS